MYGKIARKRKLTVALWHGVQFACQYNFKALVSLVSRIWCGIRMRCVWLQEKEPHCPCATLPIQPPAEVKAFFSITLKTEIGDGSRTLFWTDCWISWAVHCRFGSLLICYNSKENNSKTYCARRLTNHIWVSDLQGPLSVGVLIDCWHLWDLLFDFALQADVKGKHI